MKMDLSSLPLHGIDCPKAFHDVRRNDYMHDAGDDKPYWSDEVMYCGRCHSYLWRVGDLLVRKPRKTAK
jgi:hypothetical protein